MRKKSISVIILTYNEEIHIKRCIKRISPLVEQIFVIDSYSNDRTVEIAQELGALVFQNKWENSYAKQFNWALDTCPITTEWVIRLDADEYLSNDLINYLSEHLDDYPENIKGFTFNLKVRFINKTLKFGKLKPISLLRLWRNGYVRIEERWMDEHCIVKEGKIIKLNYSFIDDNQNGLTWWTEKHNKYANREVVDILLNEKFTEGDLSLEARNRKKGFYAKLPLFIRAFSYFSLRYFIFLGFLDGKQGLCWHFLQGFWYRFLVDAKLYQAKQVLGKKPTKELLQEYFKREYNIQI